MILTYSNPRFKDLILSGEKIHTIREDKTGRWKPGMSIQHWMGNPRNPSKNPHQFAKGECKAVQKGFFASKAGTLTRQQHLENSKRLEKELDAFLLRRKAEKADTQTKLF
jgi:hypothetical protein